MNIPFFNNKKENKLKEMLQEKEEELSVLKKEFDALKLKRDLTEKDVIESGQSILIKMKEDMENTISFELSKSKENALKIIEDAKTEAENLKKEADKSIEISINKANDFVNNWSERADKIIENAYEIRDQILNEESDYDLLTKPFIKESLKDMNCLLENTEDDISFKQKLNEIDICLKRCIKEKKAVSATAPIAALFFREIDAKPLASLCLSYFNFLADEIIEKSIKCGLEKSIDKIDSLRWRIKHSMFSFLVKFSDKYISYKIEYLKVYYAYEQYKKKKKEELAYEKEMKREEDKAQRDYERAIKQAEKDEEKARRMIEEAQRKLKEETLNENKYNELQQQIEQLNLALQEAIQRADRAKSMAEQTRRGYVYVISNLGSFGENVFKIGLTRRLDPTERIDELSNASVPFPFDIHAIIESEDAPSLEYALHKAFDAYKLNKTNWRKEFFKVSLDEIEKAVNESGIQAIFIKDFPATQYRESLFAEKL